MGMAEKTRDIMGGLYGGIWRQRKQEGDSSMDGFLKLLEKILMSVAHV